MPAAFTIVFDAATGGASYIRGVSRIPSDPSSEFGAVVDPAGFSGTGDEYFACQTQGSVFNLFQVVLENLEGTLGFLPSAITSVRIVELNQTYLTEDASYSDITPTKYQVNWPRQSQLISGETYTLEINPPAPTSPVPDVTGLDLTEATAALEDAGFEVGATSGAYSETVPVDLVISQDPAAGSEEAPGTAVDLVISDGPTPPTVPNIVGLTIGAATEILVGVLLTMGSQTQQYDATATAGTITRQTPVAGTVASAFGAPVNVVVSLGPAPTVVPDLTGQTAAGASLLLANTGLRTGDIDYVSQSTVKIGDVVAQTILPGTIVARGTRVGFTINVFLRPFDYQRTVISQYANAPTIRAMVDNMAACIDPRANLQAFYTYVWNVDTARGFGLDIWGDIVGVSRLLRIPNTENLLGFENDSIPADWKPFNGGTFYTGPGASQAYYLPDDIYRTLILTKALANIVATNAASLNRLLRNLFPGRGRCFVRDNGGMSMTFVFEFSLTPAERAILTESGALPHPAGVRYNVIVTGGGLTFGFLEQGNPAQPFDQGTFYLPPA